MSRLGASTNASNDLRRTAELAAAGIPVVAPDGVRRAALFVLVVIIATFAFDASKSILRQRADFEFFYKAGAFLLDHGVMDRRFDVKPDGTREPRGGIEWYLPGVHRIMAAHVALGRALEPLVAPLGWIFPADMHEVRVRRPLNAFDVSGLIWLTGNIIAWFAVLRLIGMYLLGLPPSDWMVTTLLPIVGGLFFWFWEFRLNQIDLFTLLLIVSSFVFWERGREKLAGFWLGLAVLLKITPGLLVVWFLLKRSWKTAGVAIVTFILAGPVGTWIAFGPEYGMTAHRSWFHTAVKETSHSGLILKQREMDWRNQGFGAVACRWLHATNWNTHFDNDPRVIIDDVEPAFINVANLPRPVLVGVVMGTLGSLALSVLWFCRRPRGELSVWRLRLEWCLILVTMLCMMPVLRRYHLITLTPVLAIILAAMHHLTWRHEWSRMTRWFLLFFLLAETAILLRLLDLGYVVEATGVLFFSTVLLLVPLLVLARRVRRRPEYLSAEPHWRSASA